MKYILYGALTIGGLVGMDFLLEGGDLLRYGFWAPKRAAVERQVFTQTQSYVQGKVSHLTLLKLEWEQASPQQRPGLRSVILLEAAQIPTTQLPAGLTVFVEKLEAE